MTNLGEATCLCGAAETERHGGHIRYACGGFEYRPAVGGGAGRCGPAPVPEIFAYITGNFGQHDLTVQAIAENGYVVASHISSDERWAKHDIGVNSKWQHERYKEHYPDGYNVVWVDNPDEHVGLRAALEMRQARLDAAQMDDRSGWNVPWT